MMKAYLEIVNLKVNDVVTASDCPTYVPGTCGQYDASDD